MPELTIKWSYTKRGHCKITLYVENNQFLVLYCVDTSGKYKKFDDLKIIFDDIIIFKEIFNEIEDYEHYITHIFAETFKQYKFDFVGYKFLSLDELHLHIRGEGVNPIINSDIMNVKILNLGFSTVSKYNPIDFIKSFTELNVLVIEGAYREYDVDINISEVIGSMKNLEKLKIHSISNVRINDNSFDGLEKLTDIQFRYCKVKSLKPFENVRNLESLCIMDDRGFAVDKSSLISFANYMESNSSIIECYISQ